jgi:hypothetical protein
VRLDLIFQINCIFQRSRLYPRSAVHALKEATTQKINFESQFPSKRCFSSDSILRSEQLFWYIQTTIIRMKRVPIILLCVSFLLNQLCKKRERERARDEEEKKMSSQFSTPFYELKIEPLEPRAHRFTLFELTIQIL